VSKLGGQHVLITGASSGIGAAVSKELERRGARIESISRRAGIRADLALPAERAQAFDEALRRLGHIDVLINNAGAGAYAPSWRANLDEARLMFEINLFAAIDLTQRAVPGMLARKAGHIVNVASIASKVTLPWFTLYSASKAALEAFSSGLRVELRRTGVGVTLVCPGYVKTNFQSSVLSGTVPPRLAHSKRFASTPERVAAAIADGIERRARTVLIPGLAGWSFVAASKLLPSLIDARLGAMMEGDDDH